MKRFALTGMYSCLLLVAPAAHAGWYLGGSAGMAHTDVSSGDLNARLANEGQLGSAEIQTKNRQGWRLFGGYQWGDYLAMEGGYTDLGQVDAKYYGVGAVPTDTLKAIIPYSGAGYELSVLARYPFTQRLSTFIRAGAFAWKSDYTVNAGSDVSVSGTDPIVGIGGAWQFADRWSLRLAWDRYNVSKDYNDLISLGVSYRFAEEHAKTISQPKPQPVVPTEPVKAAPVKPVKEKPVTPKPVPLTPQSWVVHYDVEAVEPTELDAALTAAVAKLKAYPNAVVTITGHTDNSGLENTNVNLSLQRAEQLEKALIERGIAKERITIEGKGSSEPVGDNQTKAGRAQNRRAVIEVHARFPSKK